MPSGSYTTNFNLYKPSNSDVADIADLNSNFTTIDTQLYNQSQAIADLSSIAGTSNITQTGSLQSQISALQDSVVTREFSTGKVDFEAGVIGTRAVQTIFDVALSGYSPIAASIVHTDNSSAYIPVAILDKFNSKVRINQYRCISTAYTSSAVIADVIVRVVYKKD